MIRDMGSGAYGVVMCVYRANLGEIAFADITRLALPQTRYLARQSR